MRIRNWNMCFDAFAFNYTFLTHLNYLALNFGRFSLQPNYTPFTILQQCQRSRASNDWVYWALYDFSKFDWKICPYPLSVKDFLSREDFFFFLFRPLIMSETCKMKAFLQTAVLLYYAIISRIGSNAQNKILFIFTFYKFLTLTYYWLVYFLQRCCREHHNKLDLDSFIIAPIQRVPRYELIIKVTVHFFKDKYRCSFGTEKLIFSTNRLLVSSSFSYVWVT